MSLTIIEMLADIDRKLISLQGEVELWKGRHDLARREVERLVDRVQKLVAERDTGKFPCR